MKKTPFCCGSQAWDWFANNCERCARYGNDNDIKCKYAENFLDAIFGDGKVDEETYEIIRPNESSCSLFKPVPELVEYEKIAKELKEIFDDCYYYKSNEVNSIFCHDGEYSAEKYRKFIRLVESTNLNVTFHCGPNTETLYLESNVRLTRLTGDILYEAKINGFKNERLRIIKKT